MPTTGAGCWVSVPDRLLPGRRAVDRIEGQRHLDHFLALGHPHVHSYPTLLSSAGAHPERDHLGARVARPRPNPNRSEAGRHRHRPCGSTVRATTATSDCTVEAIAAPLNQWRTARSSVGEHNVTSRRIRSRVNSTVIISGGDLPPAVEACADFPLRQPAPRVVAEHGQSRMQRPAIRDAALEHLVEQPQHPMTGDLFGGRQTTEFPVAGEQSPPVPYRQGQCIRCLPLTALRACARS